MMLNSVDLPQPDGPMIDTNSPRATRNETSSTATTEPSAVAKCLTMCSTLTKSSRGAAVSPSARSFTIVSASTARRNLDQLGQLFFGERRGRVLERDCVVDDRVQAHDAIGVDRFLRKETVARALGGRFRDADEIGVDLERARIGIHPVDRLAVRLHEAVDQCLLRLKRLCVGDQKAHRLALEDRRVVAARDHADLSLVLLLQPERRRSPP